ncbi:uncharacterized protein LOC121871397 [Homarus americanus]|uniref:uncharacterized protein LOC121871397 n=1 Tax=Homarus americanus TaxID=6706 RepID=UPI001C444FA3|nr:uncharacterized protein LOC121871397 [Homarus americanus]
MCMSCGLPCYPIGECAGSVGFGGIGGFHHLQSVSCHCTTPAVGSSLFSMSCPVSPTLPVLPSESFYVSRPYAILTKYITNMYRRKIITKKLLRQLAGDQEDVNVLYLVQLRRHKTECSIKTGDESSNDSDLESKHQEMKKFSCSEEKSDTSESSSDGGYWVGEEPENRLGVLSPIPKKKQYPFPNISSTASSNLQKWRYQTRLTDKRFNSSISSSGESGVSTDGSNPYGYVRYYNPEDSSIASFKGENLHFEGSAKRCTYTKPYGVQQDYFINDNRGEKSSSCDEYYYCLPHGKWPTLSSIPGGENYSSEETGLAQFGKDSQFEEVNIAKDVTKSDCLIVRPTYKFFKVYSGGARRDSECNVIENSADPYMCTGLSSSRSLPMISSNLVLQGKDDGTLLKTTHSSTLNIPAIPMILPSYLVAESDGELTESSPNVCDRTIYESSISSDDVLGLEGVLDESGDRKKVYPFKTKSDVAYYVSSCSGDETGEDRVDYYESHRKQVPINSPLSRSEPNLWRRIPSTRRQSETPKYSSHYVQLVHSVENPAKVCNCESHSHRSSDSGLADVIHHLECCPLRSETPGFGRGSSISRCSHSSQFSNIKSSRSASSCQVRPFTPDCGADGDSLLVTPVTTPYTSASVSYAEDSLSSLMDSVTLDHSTSAHELSYTSYSEPTSEEAVFRSGLYAHWWMKASVCPKAIILDKSKKDFLRFRTDKKPDVPPKPKFLKPSYHIRRGGTKRTITKPAARSASTQTNFTQSSQSVKLQIMPPVSSSCLKHNVVSSSKSVQSQGDQSVRPKLRKISSHLSPQTSVTMSRDRSFESQASQISQVTVIPRIYSEREVTSSESQGDQLTVPLRANLNTLKIQSNFSQESSGTSGNSCTELSSLHSFSESCERDGNPPHLRDSSEGLDVDFHRRASSHSLHVDVAPSDAFKSTLYCHLQPIPCISTQKSNSGILKTDSGPSAPGVSSSSRDECLEKPSLPPKPPHLQPWPIKRSKSLPKLPLSSISIHNQSKDFAS